MNGLAWSPAIAVLLPLLLASSAGGAEDRGTVRVTQAAPAPKAAQQQRGPAAPGQAAAPQQILTRTDIQYFDNWTVTCNEFAEGPRTRVCAALLQVVQQENNQRVFAWNITLDNNKQMLTELQTLTGVAIPPGVELRIGKNVRKVPFTACDTAGCLASLPMDAALVRELTASPTVDAVIQARQGNAVQYNIQMKGFDKAVAVLSKS
jgi:invasion protein IalB